MDTWQLVVSVVTSFAASGGFSWMGKLGVERALDRSIHRDLEHYKSQLQLHAQVQIERLKADLQLQAQQELERLRHEMQKQMLRAQLVTTKTQEVYSQLIKLIRDAEGKIVGLLGARFSRDYRQHSLQEIEQVLVTARVPSEMRDEILGHWNVARQEAIKNLEKVLRFREMDDARVAYAEAKNHIVLEGIFMTNPVRERALRACSALWNAWVAAHVIDQAQDVKKFMEDFERASKQAAEEVAQLEEAMRADLLPSLVPLHSGTHTSPPAE